MAKTTTKKTKYIVWFVPEGKDKKLQFNQFHTEATSVTKAMKNLEVTAKFQYKVIGVSGYDNLGKKSTNIFINNKFY